MDIAKLQMTPAYRMVSDDLRQRIVRGEVKEGEPFPIEADLASKFGVHRSTIREALRVLEQEGLLRRAGKRLQRIQRGLLVGLEGDLGHGERA